MNAVAKDIELDLRRRIAAGEWQVGFYLPGQQQLAEHYRAARETIKRALKPLIDQGIIDSRKGCRMTLRVAPPQSSAVTDPDALRWDKVETCYTCGGVVIAAMAETHRDWHTADQSARRLLVLLRDLLAEATQALAALQATAAHPATPAAEPGALLLTITEAGVRLGLGPTTVYQLINAGQLASVRIGRACAGVPTTAIDDYIRRQLQTPTEGDGAQP